MRNSAALFVLLVIFAGSLNAESLLADLEATVQSGTAANSNIDEVAAGYLHVKHHEPLTLARKAYFQFDFSNSFPNLESPAEFQVFFKNTFPQRVQLWALNGPYETFSAHVSWNSAQANDTNSNSLLTNGTFTASLVGTNVLIPTTGTTPFSFAIPRLGDFIFGNKITLVLSGVDDPSNNAAGLRLITNSATLNFLTTNPPPSDTNDYDVYLLAGQSNMDGRGYTNDLTGDKAFWNRPQTNTLIYYANPVNSDPLNPTYNTGWQILKPGFCVPPNFSGSLPSPRFGPELSFAKTIAAANPNRRLALIKISQGGTSLSGDWKPSTGYMYATLTNMARIALDDLVDQGHSYTVRGMIWHQGESDSSGTALTNYESNMTQFIAAVRRDLQITNLPFVIGEVATNKPAELRAKQFNLSQTIPYVGFASADALVTVDGTHFDSAGVLILGQRFVTGLEVPPTKFEFVARVATGIVITASGLAGSSCILLSSTNLNLPLSQWEVGSKKFFNSMGRLQFTNSFSGNPQTFYALKPL